MTMAEEIPDAYGRTSGVVAKSYCPGCGTMLTSGELCYVVWCSTRKEQKSMSSPHGKVGREMASGDSLAPVEEKIDHPQHYGGKDAVYEVIKVIRAWHLDFVLGNAVKYIARAGRKPGETRLDDLRKARWYLDNEIAEEEARIEAAKAVITP